MRRANVIEKDMAGIGTLKDLTNVFESLASTQVAKVKSKAQLSQEFFELLWQRYTSIRIDPRKQITNREQDGNGRTVMILISAEAGLSGDLDMRVIETMQATYDPKTTDIIVLGSHGAGQLSQRGIPYIGSRSTSWFGVGTSWSGVRLGRSTRDARSWIAFGAR